MLRVPIFKHATRQSVTFRGVTPLNTMRHAPQERQSLRRHTTIVSRRQWNEYLQKQQPRLKKTNKASTAKPDAADADKGWPRSVIWTGYALAATFIPYTVIWICLTNETSRPWILNHCNATVENILRSHFGTDDLDAVSYTDWRANGEAIPRVFLGELSHPIRRQQEEIQHYATTPLRVRVQVWDATTSTTATATATRQQQSVTEPVLIEAETEMELPATMPATRESVQAQCASQGSSNNNNNKLKITEKTAMAIDFPLRKLSSLSSENLLTDEQQQALQENNVSDQSTPAGIDPLRTETRVYSLWHYQPAVPETTSASTNKSSSAVTMTDDDLRANRLRHQIAVLQQELKNSTVATRPIDDIVDELESAKRELRQLQWKKWLPWS